MQLSDRKRGLVGERQNRQIEYSMEEEEEILNRLKGMLTIKVKQSSYYASWRDNDERHDDPVGFHPTNKILKKG